jgi:multidrug efflux pump subunit AcrA (membrane-fusion protein)
VKGSGRVLRLSPAIDAQNRSLVIEGEIPNTNGALRPGSFVQGIITINPNATGIAVPRSAVVTFAGVERVFVVDGGVLDERIVRTGRIMDGEVEIVSGLRAGDRLVVNANDRMSKGRQVKAG